MTQSIVLVVAAFLTSMLSGMIGLGGGTILAALMFSVLPTAQVVPLHAVVQIASNGSRTVANFKDVQFSALTVFLLVAIPATFIVAPLVVNASPDRIRLTMGLFLLATYDSRWLKKIGLGGNLGLAAAGLIAGGLGTAVGATGAMMAPFFFRPEWKKEAVVGTQAVCQGAAHLFKIVAFSSLGFALGANAGLAAMMIVAVIGGTFVGKMFLDKLDDKHFRRLYAIVVVALGIELIVRAVRGLAGIG